MRRYGAMTSDERRRHWDRKFDRKLAAAAPASPELVMPTNLVEITERGQRAAALALTGVTEAAKNLELAAKYFEEAARIARGENEVTKAN